MFLVLVVHADFLSLGEPSAHDFSESAITSLCRVFIQSLAIICVNLFVLISGWFQIKPTVKGGIKFIFQCLCMSVLIMAGGYFFNVYDFNNTKEFLRLISTELFFNFSSFWFIKAYLVLYVLSPVLNTFLCYASTRSIIITLILFFLLQSIWSGLHHFKMGFYSNGYSPLSFIGLYLLSNTIRRFYTGYTMKQAFTIFFCPLILLFVIASFSYWCNISLPYDLFAYSNPLVICEAVGLLLIFARLRIKPNRLINWISASSFAVYLFHVNPLVFPKYLYFVKYIYNHTCSIVTLLAILGFIIAVYIIGILLDQPRKMMWRLICNKITFRSPF